jgi:hypothetical protein
VSTILVPDGEIQGQAGAHGNAADNHPVDFQVIEQRHQIIGEDIKV